MAKTIFEIYTKYKIMPSLQEHMYRVAAVASIICDHLDEPNEKEEIITACLLHDMGNIIKFKVGVLPEFYKPEGVEYWQSIQDEYLKKYGKDEHKATIEILKELGISSRITSIVDRIDFLLFCNNRNSNDIPSKIALYADTRVDPYGVVSYDDRMLEGKKRYQNHKSTFGGVDEEKRQKLVACGKDIEKQIFAKCKIKPEDINNETVAPIIEQLRSFVIK